MKILFLILITLFALPGVAQEDDEQIVEQLEKQSAERLDKLKKTAPQEIALATDSIKSIIEQTDFSKFRTHELREMIRGQMKDRPLGKLFETFPKLLDVVVDIVRDKKALLGLVGIMDRREDLKQFSLICLVLFIISLYLRRIFLKPVWNFFVRIIARLTFSFGLTALTIYIFYQMFQKEVDPTLEILKRHF